MKKPCFLFSLKPNVSIDLLKEKCLSLGLEEIFTIEGKNSSIGGLLKEDFLPSFLFSLPEISSFEKISLDWEKQWETFAKNFSQGSSRIDLKKYGSPHTMVLLPGGGFGDLSHPTTQLMLELMQGNIKEKEVLDVGCGSGILSIGAHFMECRKVVGIDICTKSLQHAKKNALANHLKEKIVFSKKTPSFFSPSVILMNMTMQEQIFAFPSLSFSKKEKFWITSGILQEQKKTYLSFAEKQGLSLLKCKQKNSWLGMIFKS